MSKANLDVGTNVVYQNNQGFILDEEKIRKINDIITTHAQSIDQQCKPIYKLILSDISTNETFSDETDDIEKVLKQENSSSRKIVQLSFYINYKKNNENFDFLLIFDNSTKLKIEGQNRALLYRIYTDLKLYLLREVNFTPKIEVDKVFSWQILPLVLVVVMFGWSIISLTYRDYRNQRYEQYHEQELTRWKKTRDENINRKILQNNKEAKQALDSKDNNTKLNFLIRKNIKNIEDNSEFGYPSYNPPKATFYEKPWFPVILLSGVTLLFSLSRLLILNIYHEEKNVFLIGKEIIRHSDLMKKKQKLRENILWVVVVGSVVGLIISIASPLILGLFQSLNNEKEKGNKEGAHIINNLEKNN